MLNQMNHKGYIGMVNYDDEAGIFYGEVVNTRDVITFQGASVEELRQAFIDSVEDYLDFCKERSEEPDRPFSGKILVRISPELHQKAYLRAKEANISLNEWMNQAVEQAIEKEPV